MAGYRSRSRSPSYSPRRRYSRSPPRRSHYDDPRDRYRGGGGGGARRGYGRPSAQSGLLIRNISLTARPEDIRVPFEKFGPVKDVYLPRNFHTRELRGFGFVKFLYPKDAALAKQELNHQVVGGREISIVYAEENRKTPQEMRMRTRTRYMDRRYTRRSLSRSPRSRSHSYSPSPSPVRRDLRGRDHRDNYSPEETYSRPPRDNRHCRSDSRSPTLDGRKAQASPVTNGHGPPVVSSPR